MIRYRPVDEPTPSAPLTDFCNQCYRDRPLEAFVSRNGRRFTKQCIECRDRYRNWDALPVEERAERMREKPRTGIGYLVALTLFSGNRKTGPIPVSMTDMQSCPSSCVFRDQGCYAEFGQTRAHWQTVPERGTSWRDFCAAVAALPEGTLWRHNEAGDLPGRDEDLDVHALAMLARANQGRRGFTFTHRKLEAAAAREAVRHANELGFTINLSANSLEHADELAELGVGPVAVVLPEDAWLVGLTTPAGRMVVNCLNDSDGLTCAECRLCAAPQRKSIVAFRAHGQASAIVSEIVRTNRKAASA